MKKSIFFTLLIFILFFVASTIVLGDPPPPPGGGDPPGGPGTGHTYIGGVPIAGGILILIALAAGYGARKLYNARKRRISE